MADRPAFPGDLALPADLDAEAAVLSAMILDTSDVLVDQVRSILAGRECFYSDAHKHIFDAVCALSDAGEPQDAVTIANWLRANDKWNRVRSDNLIRVIDGTPAVPNVLSHAAVVRDMYRVRRTIQEAGRIRTEASTLKGADPNQLREFLQANENVFADLAHEGQETKLRPLADVMVDTEHVVRLASQQKSTVTGVPTGFVLLDRMMTGLHDGDTSVIAGRPGSGKTAFGLSTAKKMAEGGYAVAFFSLEMPGEPRGLRLLSMESGIDLNQLRSGRLDAGEWVVVEGAIKRLSVLPLFVNDSPTVSLFDVRAGVRQLQREIAAGKHPKCTKGRIGAVFVDYLQLMAPMQKGRSREEEVAETSRGFKRLAKQQGIPYVVLAQLNRQVEQRTDHRPKLSDLRESGAIEQDADNVIFIHRPEQHVKDDPELKGVAEAIVAKQRNGPVGTAKLAFKSECTRFENIDYYHHSEDDEKDDGFDVDQQTFDDAFGGVP